MIKIEAGSLEHDAIIQFGDIEVLNRNERKSGSDYVTVVIHITESPVMYPEPDYNEITLNHLVGTWFVNSGEIIVDRCYSVDECVKRHGYDLYKAREIKIISYEIED